MRTSHLLSIAVIALGLAATGCGNKSNVVPTETKTMPTTPVDLKVNWPPGRHGVHTDDTQMTMEMNMPWAPSQTVTQATTMTMETALTALPKAADGQRALEMEMVKTRMDVSIGGKSMLNFDSSKSSAGDTNPAAGTLGKVIGAKVRFILDDSNYVTSVDGADELFQKLTSSRDTDPAGTMKSMFSGDALKLQVDFARHLAGHPVQPGDTWPIHMEYPLGQLGTLVMDFTNTLTSWEKHHDRWCAKIDFEGTIQSKPGDSPGVQGMKLNFHDGTCSGETWFNIDMGMFEDGTLYQDAKVDITIPNPMARKPGQPKMATINGAMHQVINTKFELK